MKAAHIIADEGRKALDEISPKSGSEVLRSEKEESKTTPSPIVETATAVQQPEPMPHITTISQRGLDLIKEYEGFSAKPYLCPAGVWTIGYGSTFYENGERVKKTDPAISKERAESLLRAVVAQFEKGVDSLTRDDLTQSQFDALVSFAYNLGVQAYKNSTLAKKVNAKPNDPAIRAEFNKWRMAAGKVMPGLVRRRAAESDLYFS